MLKKLLNSFLAITLVVTAISPAFAAEPKVLFEVDCNTLNKDVKIGFQSDPADPDNGAEVIAYEFTMTLEPVSGSVIADLANAKFEANSAYSNMIVAQNTSSTNGNTRVLKIAAGFTQQTGINNANDLFFIKNVQQKPYKLTVTEGKLFPKSGGDDIYTDAAPKQTFTADPSACQAQSGTQNQNQSGATTKNVAIENFTFTPSDLNVNVGDTVTWTNSDSTAHTVTSIGAGPLDSGNIAAGASFSHTFTEAGTFEYQCQIHPSMRGKVIVAAAASGTDTGSSQAGTANDNSSNTAATSITLSSSLQQANAADEVVVTAVISNLNGNNIDWSQTAGNRIEPQIQNQALEDNKTQSQLTFTMPTPANNVTLRIKVGEATETITIEGTDNASAGAAPTDEGTTATDNTDSLSLQERLEQRRQELEAAANPSTTQEPSGTVHQAAGAGLARSGPGDTTALALVALAMVYVLRRKKKNLESDAV